MRTNKCSSHIYNDVAPNDSLLKYELLAIRAHLHQINDSLQKLGNGIIMAYGGQSNLYLALNMYDRALELEPSGLPLLHSEGQFRKAHLTIGRWRKYKIANLCFLPQKAYLCGSVTSTNRRNEHHPEKETKRTFLHKSRRENKYPLARRRHPDGSCCRHDISRKKLSEWKLLGCIRHLALPLRHARLLRCLYSLPCAEIP